MGCVPGPPNMVGGLIFRVGCVDSHHKVNNQHKPRRTKTRTRRKRTASLAKARLDSHNECADTCGAVSPLWAVTIRWVSLKRGRKQLHTHSLDPNRTKTKKNRATQTYIRFGVVRATDGRCEGPLFCQLCFNGARGASDTSTSMHHHIEPPTRRKTATKRTKQHTFEEGVRQ